MWQTKKRTLIKEQEARVNKESKAKITVYGGGIKPLYKKKKQCVAANLIDKGMIQNEFIVEYNNVLCNINKVKKKKKEKEANDDNIILLLDIYIYYIYYIKKILEIK